MLTATKDRILPTTVTGSWPRPTWYTAELRGRPFSDAMTDLQFREQFTDAVAAVVNDQERAGLDIVTNGDYHLDADHAGRSWFIYPTERLDGHVGALALVHEPDVVVPGRHVAERDRRRLEVPARGRQGRPEDPARVRQDLARRPGARRTPVKFGTISADLASAVLEVGTDVYDDDKKQLMWDIAEIINADLRELAAAGCKVIQVEEPAIHSSAAYGADSDTLDFLVDLFNRHVEGLDDVEVWVHTCWGNPGAQHCFDPNISYENSIDIYLNRLNADVWTIESKDAGHKPLELFEPYKGQLAKKVAVGFISHRTLSIESPEEIAGDVRRALEYIDAEHLVLSSDCGFGRQGVPRPVAYYKAAALALRGEHRPRRARGRGERGHRGRSVGLQVDIPEGAPALVS